MEHKNGNDRTENASYNGKSENSIESRAASSHFDKEEPGKCTVLLISRCLTPQVLLRAVLPPMQNSIPAPQARRLKSEKPNDHHVLVCGNYR
jgi:hypothetical protein